MSYNQYSGYGGNPYGGGEPEQPTTTAGSGGYGTANPYASDAGNPYGGNYGASTGGYGQATHEPSSALQPPTMQHHDSNYSRDSDYSQGPTSQQVQQPGQNPQQVRYVQAGPAVLSNQDFLSRVEAVKADIRTLTTHVGQIASMHQRTLSATDTSSSQLESMITQTQILNTSIKDQIKFLETDAVRSRDNSVKTTQVRQLKGSFQKQIQEYRTEEATYEKRYREQIARQYRIVNPEASDAEVAEAADADWGNEGVFQTALKSNRSATASSVLGAVRARHNDIQKIERTMAELQQLMEDLATAVVLQDAPIQATEQSTANVKQDTEAGNAHLDKGITSARRARKLKWWCLLICVIIIAIIALVLGLYFGLMNKNKK